MNDEGAFAQRLEQKALQALTEEGWQAVKEHGCTAGDVDDLRRWDWEAVSGYGEWIAEGRAEEAANLIRHGISCRIASALERCGAETGGMVGPTDALQRLSAAGVGWLRMPHGPTSPDLPVVRAMVEVLEAAPEGVLCTRRGWTEANAAALLKLPAGWRVARSMGAEIDVPAEAALLAVQVFALIPGLPTTEPGTLDVGEVALLLAPFFQWADGDFFSKDIDSPLQIVLPGGRGKTEWNYDSIWRWPVPAWEDTRAKPLVAAAPDMSGSEATLWRLGPRYLAVRFDGRSIVGVDAFTAYTEAEARTRFMRWIAEPAAWAPAAVEAWIGSGGTPQQAEALGGLGWTSTEALDAVNAASMAGVSVALLEPPAAAADVCRSLGDSLADLVTGTWPAVPPAAVMSVKRSWRDGRRSRHLLVRGADAGDRRISFQLSPKGWREERAEEGWTVGRVLEQYPLAADVITVIHTVPGLVDEVSAIADCPLSIDGGPSCGDGWAAGQAERWVQEDEEYAEDLSARLFPRWASINGYRVTGLQMGDDEEDAVALVLIDPRLPEFVPLRELASYDWFSESGGAPISWDGHHRLLELPNGVMLDHAYGDTDTWSDLSHMPSSPEGLARDVIHWIQRAECQTAAALALQPLDPDERLASGDRAHWQELLDTVTVRARFDLPQDVAEAVLEQLGGPAAALRDPTSEAGRQLLQLLEEAVESGVTGELLAWS